jgi:hypothetical protein
MLPEMAVAVAVTAVATVAHVVVQIDVVAAVDHVPVEPALTAAAAAVEAAAGTAHTEPLVLASAVATKYNENQRKSISSTMR